MTTSDRRARMRLSCAINGGAPAVAELVQKLGAEGAWAKIIEGALGEPTAQRAARVTVEVFERLATAAAARFIIPGDEEWPAGLADLGHAESIQRHGGEPVGLWLRGPAISLTLWNGQPRSRAYGQQRRTGPALRRIWPEHRRDYPSKCGGSIYAGQPFRTVLRDLQLTPNQIWVLTKTDQEWSENLEAALTATPPRRPRSRGPMPRMWRAVSAASAASISGSGWRGSRIGRLTPDCGYWHQRHANLSAHPLGERWSGTSLAGRCGRLRAA